MDKRDRVRVDGLVEIYVNHFTGDDRAGWAGKNQLQTLKEHAGEMPVHSGGYQSDRMLLDLHKVRGKHSQLYVAVWLLGYVKSCPACKLTDANCPDCGGTGFVTVSGELPSRYAVPLIASGVFASDTNQTIAETLAITLKQYETRLATGRAKMAEELNRLDRLRRVKDRLGRTDHDAIRKADEASRGFHT